MRRLHGIGWTAFSLGLAFAGPSTSAFAGVFNVPHFVGSEKFAFGFEPELTLTDGAGLAGNLKFVQGLNELSDLTVILGTGDGPRKFRVGGNVTFDFFPDLESQPGIGIAVQGLWYRTPGDGRLELTAVPYIHKTIHTEADDIEPFLAVPFGWAFFGGQYQQITNVVVGNFFKGGEHFRYVAEFGIDVNNSETYFSGGVIYY